MCWLAWFTRERSLKSCRRPRSTAAEQRRVRERWPTAAAAISLFNGTKCALQNAAAASTATLPLRLNATECGTEGKVAQANARLSAAAALQHTARGYQIVSCGDNWRRQQLQAETADCRLCSKPQPPVACQRRWLRSSSSSSGRYIPTTSTSSSARSINDCSYEHKKPATVASTAVAAPDGSMHQLGEQKRYAMFAQCVDQCLFTIIDHHFT